MSPTPNNGPSFALLVCRRNRGKILSSDPPDLGTLFGGQSGLVHKTNVGETDRESGTHKFTQNETFQPLFITVLYILHWATMIKDKLLTLRHFELKMLNHQPSPVAGSLLTPTHTHPTLTHTSCDNCRETLALAGLFIPCSCSAAYLWSPTIIRQDIGKML